MLKHVFSVACQSSSVDQFSNNLSLYNVLERVEAKSSKPLAITSPLHGIPFECCVVSLWYNEGPSDEDAKQRLTLIAPDGRRFNPHETPFVVKAGQAHRLIAKVPQLPFFGNGRYWFEVALQTGADWLTVALFPFMLEYIFVETPTPKLQ